jgi:hypothetical protein
VARLSHIYGRHGAAAHPCAEHIKWHCPNWPGIKCSYSWSLFFVWVCLTYAFPLVSHGAQLGEILVLSSAEGGLGPPKCGGGQPLDL